MAKEGFDFDALKGLAYNEYVKTTCKKNKVEKAKGGLVVRKFDLSNKKKANLFIPFLKQKDAILAFKALKKDKTIHLVKNTALVSVFRKKEDITLTILQGGMTADDVKSGVDSLFANINMKLTVTGESSSDEVGSDSSETSTEDSGKDEKLAEKAAKKAARAEKRYKMLEGIDKMKKAKAQGKISVEQINAQIEKYDVVLDRVTKEAEADGNIDEIEKGEIEEVVAAIKNLKNDLENIIEGGEKKTRKLTPKERETIVSNMDKMDKKLQQILAKLG